VPALDTMASISEDCKVKLWSMKNLAEEHKSSGGNVEPYLTLRGHTAPLLSITGPNQTSNPAYNRLIFTAGVEGSIRLWNLPAIREVN